MGVGQVSVAAATAIVGYDLFEGEWFQRMAEDRTITGIAIAGSANAGDTRLELMIETRKVGEYFNKATGFPLRDQHTIPIEEDVDEGEAIHCYVKVAPTTNPINVDLEWEE